jgi:hypothetical protein
MPRLPSRIQGQPFGTANPATSTPAALRPAVQLVQAGPAQAKQWFTEPDISDGTARALNTLQRKIDEATSQVRADPTADKNVIEQVPLKNGTTGGGNFNVIPHGLGFTYRDYRICSVRNGYITGHCAIPPDAGHPANAVLSLWTQVVQFKAGVPVSATIEIWG